MKRRKCYFQSSKNPRNSKDVPPAPPRTRFKTCMLYSCLRLPNLYLVLQPINKKFKYDNFLIITAYLKSCFNTTMYTEILFYRCLSLKIAFCYSGGKSKK